MLSPYHSWLRVAVLMLTPVQGFVLSISALNNGHSPYNDYLTLEIYRFQWPIAGQCRTLVRYCPRVVYALLIYLVLATDPSVLVCHLALVDSSLFSLLISWRGFLLFLFLSSSSYAPPPFPFDFLSK